MEKKPQLDDQVVIDKWWHSNIIYVRSSRRSDPFIDP